MERIIPTAQAFFLCIILATITCASRETIDVKQLGQESSKKFHTEQDDNKNKFCKVIAEHFDIPILIIDTLDSNTGRDAALSFRAYYRAPLKKKEVEDYQGHSNLTAKRLKLTNNRNQLRGQLNANQLDQVKNHNIQQCRSGAS